jgi:hypothetical protein
MKKHRIPKPSAGKNARKNGKIKQRFPPGWNEKRVRELIDYYDNQSEEERAAEIEAAYEAAEREAAARATAKPKKVKQKGSPRLEQKARSRAH